MFNKRTIFILGAGASSEANLPTGAQLIPLIRQKLNFRSSLSNHHQSRQRRLKSGDAAIAHAIEEHCKQHKHDDFAKCYAAGRFIHRGLLTSTSIDDFLDVHRDDKYVQFCGKLAIVQSILEAERNSLFSFDFESDALQFETLADSWFLQFIRLLRQGIPSADRDRIFENVGFINFNYDRCLEYFIYHALRQGYGLNAVATSELLGRLRIVHPYGSVGKLKSWDGEAGIDFGADEYDLPNLAAGIKIYTEQVADVASMQMLRNLLAQAEVLVFLGFAFHPQNMKLLSIDGDSAVSRVFATAHQISVSDANVIRKMIRVMLGKANNGVSDDDLQIFNTSCCGLFRDQWRTLAME